MIEPYFCARYYSRNTVRKVTVNGRIRAVSFDLSCNEIANLEQNVGNLISTNGYLSTSRRRTVAYEFAKEPSARQGIVSVLFEYQVDLNMIKKIVLADIAQYSMYPSEAEMLFGIGKPFKFIVKPSKH
jgi:hypothetical protein